MLNLNDFEAFHQLDPQDMIGEINRLPQHLLAAWELGQALPLPQVHGVKGILIAGMGGSGIGAELAATYAARNCPLPVAIHRDYGLPAWAQSDTLVIISSHSGNTEESISAFEQAQAKGCPRLVITTGGRLAQMARENGVPVWQFQHEGQPRAAVGFTFGYLLAALSRLGLIPDPEEELHETLHALRNQQTNLFAEVPLAFNPAKRLAGQFIGRSVVIFAADFLAPVARRWKDQISENAKAWASFAILPEADHNTLAGLNNPESGLSNLMAVFLQSADNHPRNQLRLDFTRQMFMTQGINTDTFQARGEGEMAQLWTALHFGDYTSYYLAMAYGEDPTPVDALEMLKQAMRDSA